MLYGIGLYRSTYFAAFESKIIEYYNLSFKIILFVSSGPSYYFYIHQFICIMIFVEQFMGVEFSQIPIIIISYS